MESNVMIGIYETFNDIQYMSNDFDWHFGEVSYMQQPCFCIIMLHILLHLCGAKKENKNVHRSGLMQQISFHIHLEVTIIFVDE